MGKEPGPDASSEIDRTEACRASPIASRENQLSVEILRPRMGATLSACHGRPSFRRVDRPVAGGGGGWGGVRSRTSSGEAVAARWESVRTGVGERWDISSIVGGGGTGV